MRRVTVRLLELGCELLGPACHEADAPGSDVLTWSTRVQPFLAAVEQQSAATGEIARNVQQTAQSTKDVTSNIGGVRQAANDTGSAATEVLGAAIDLSRQAERLSSEVSVFVANVRSA